MRRLYLNTPLSILPTHEPQALTEDAFHYVVRVLRCRDGEHLCVFNGDGFDYMAILTLIGKKNASIKVIEAKKNDNESPLYTVLMQCLSKGDRMDIVMQKAVELGVNEIIPVRTTFCAVKLDEKRLEKKMQHWQSIITSACEQSERAVVPILHPLQSLPEALNIIQTDVKWVLHPYLYDSKNKSTDKNVDMDDIDKNFVDNIDKKCVDNKDKDKDKDNQNEGKYLSTAIKRPKSVTILIGPEGGLTDAEVESAVESDFHPQILGKRILRTETAAIASLSLCQQLWGDCYV